MHNLITAVAKWTFSSYSVLIEGKESKEGLGSGKFRDSFGRGQDYRKEMNNVSYVRHYMVIKWNSLGGHGNLQRC